MVIKAILRSFELASCLIINYTKSNVIGINIEEHLLKVASVLFACSIRKIPFKFLGIPIGANLRKLSTKT